MNAIAHPTTLIRTMARAITHYAAEAPVLIVMTAIVMTAIPATAL